MKMPDPPIKILLVDDNPGGPTRRGLSLMAMQERAHMMGGSLEIRSEEGKETRITLMIPVSASQAG